MNAHDKQPSKEFFIKSLFGRIAKRYDLLNDLMTFSLHRIWKQKTIKSCDLSKISNAKILDLCTGTGDLAFMWARQTRVKEVIGIDTCVPMLEEARVKLTKQNNYIRPKIKFVEGDTLDLPYEDEYFHAVTIGFGLRNVEDLQKALTEIKRVLKPGGYVACLDLGHPHIPLVDMLYKKIFLKLVPILGSQIAHDKDAYQYLVNSLKTWPSQRELSQIFWDMGFKRSYYQDLALGTVAIVVAEK